MVNKMTAYRVPAIYGSCTKKRDPVLVAVPGSKSITNRALLLATLAKGESILRGALFSDDSRHFLQCLLTLGFDAREDEESNTIRILGLGGRVPKEDVTIDVGSAGTAARFLTAYLGMNHGSWDITSSEQMKKRPMQPLLMKLEELGAEITCTEAEGHFPVHVTGHGVLKPEVIVNIDSSSQFLSALLISSVLCEQDLLVGAEGHHGMAYITMTIKMMEQFGVKAEKMEDGGNLAALYRIGSDAEYQALDYRIEPDMSAAAYFYAAAAILGISVLVEHIHFGGLQGDTEFLRILEKMGCRVEDTVKGILLTGPDRGKLHGLCCDMSSCSDQAITLAAIAPYCDSPVTITGIGHIRNQESDRLLAIEENLNRMGIQTEVTSDSITIYPGQPEPAEIETYDDHRLAMGFSLTGLRADGIVIRDPLCCRKTFENYFDVLDDFVRKLTDNR